MAVDGSTFRKALGAFASGVTVVTGRAADGEPVGLTVSAFSSLSLDPPLILVCLDKATRSAEALTGGPFAVNILAEDQQAVSNHFASRKDKRFDGVEWQAGEVHGSPLLSGSLAHLQCAPHEVLEGGDHLIVVGRVEAVDVSEEGKPLTYFRGGYRILDVA